MKPFTIGIAVTLFFAHLTYAQDPTSKSGRVEIVAALDDEIVKLTDAYMQKLSELDAAYIKRIQSSVRGDGNRHLSRAHRCCVPYLLFFCSHSLVAPQCATTGSVCSMELT